MSRSSTPATGRKDIFGFCAGAAIISPSISPAEDTLSARALQRRRAKDATQALLSPARSSPQPASVLAETAPKASPAKGSRPREPAVFSTVVSTS